MQLGVAGGDATVSKVEFDVLLLSPQAAKILGKVNADSLCFVELSDLILAFYDVCIGVT